MKKYFLIILVFINLFWSSPTHADYLYSHINLGWVIYTDITSQTWFGQRANILIGGSHTRHYSTALAANSNLIITYYIGQGLYKYGYTNSYDAMRLWADANEYDAEDYLQHYYEDKAWTTDAPRPTTVLVTGESSGFIPGYPGGTAIQRSDSRVINGTWGAAVNATKTILSIVRSSGTVTVQTSTNHGMEKGDRIAIAGVTDQVKFPDGNYNIATRVDDDEFTITWAGDDGSSSSGTVNYKAWSAYNVNYISDVAHAYLKSRINDSDYGCDADGNKFNGFFHDNVLGQHYEVGLELDKTVEYQETEPPPSSVSDWLFDIIADWIIDLKSQWTTYLAGGKTAYCSVNADDLSKLVTAQMPFYQADGPDIILLEYGVGPNATSPDTYIETYSKNAWELMNTYNKKLIWQCGNYATRPAGEKTWTLHSGAIWYADFPYQTVELYGPGAITGHKSSIEAMTANSHYWDAANKRLYVWMSDSGDPNNDVIGYYGLDQSRIMTLAWYYCFHHANAYYFPWTSGGASYAVQPDAPYNWFEAVGYDIGSPTTGGQKRDNSGNWSTGTDLWSESLSTSSKGYEMWRGNGVETDDLSYALSSTHRLYARKFSNGYAIFRTRVSYTEIEYAGTRPKTFTTPFIFRKLNADGSLEAPTQSFTLAQGEGVILITNIGSTPSYYGISSGGATFR